MCLSLQTPVVTKHVAETTRKRPSRAAFVLDPERPVLTHRHDLARASSIIPHQHPRHQLLWAADGVLRVTTDQAVWIVPSSHAVWIPGGTTHTLVTETAARTRNLYVDPSQQARPSGMGCELLLLTSLAREMILRLNSPELQEDPARSRRLGLAALDEIRTLESSAWYLPAGRDPRLRRLIGELVDDPANPHTFEELSRRAGAGVRTMERLFKTETGMDFRHWRTRLRMLSSLELLRQGHSSSSIASSLGYRGVSAYVSAFTRQFACPPQDFAAKQNP